ncbi:MAG: hypothetical protein DRP03_02595 [Candidatus Aenigmatarchaeota archaeon]|nr:MAG: hypothetical protein DRP03_02595 [Candidatus Aenigmarchaeota archaeon]
MDMGLFELGVEEACVKTYREMKEAMEELAKAHGDLEPFTVGKSSPKRSGERLDIVGLVLKPLCSASNATIWFVSGHHNCECSGPETVYELSRRISESESEDMLKIRENKAMVFIPQINSVWYDGFEENVKDKLGYDADLNVYFGPPSTISGIASETRAVKSTIRKLSKKYGKPVLAFDFHEGSSSGRFEIEEAGAGYPYNILDRLESYFPVEKEGGKGFTYKYGFTSYIKKRFPSARAFLIESFYKAEPLTPFNMHNPYKGKITLRDRIEANLMAVELILSEMFID